MAHQLIWNFQKRVCCKVVQLGQFLCYYFNFPRDSFQRTSDDIKKVEHLAKKVPDKKINIAVDLIEEIKKWSSKNPNKGSRILITNNEVKDIIKVIRSLENRRNFLKGTTKNR